MRSGGAIRSEKGACSSVKWRRELSRSGNHACGAGAPDVEYTAGGASCPGAYYASSSSDANEIGVSTVFPPSCAADNQTPLDPSTLADTVLGVNVVEEIATCPGAQQPNGGAVNPAGATQCGPFATDPGASGATSCSPAGISFAQAQLLYTQQIGNERGIGGCTHSNAVQNRVQGSGDRITFCFNVYGTGNDTCANEGSALALAPTTGTEVNDVCGPTAADGNYAQGYVSRAVVVADPRNTFTPKTALQGCGVVTVGGYSGYNGSCDPSNPTADPNHGYGTNPGSGVPTCNGDLAVALGQYQIWGYLHLDLNAAATQANTNPAAQGFLNFLESAPDDVQDFGFLQPCQMDVSRSVDAGPYVATTATC